MNKTLSNKELVTRLRDYVLPEGVLPAIAGRHLFEDYSLGALEQAIMATTAFPESRGIMPRAIRALTGDAPFSKIPDAVTMEAHLDATALPKALADQVIALGFSPDPFAVFNPLHYATHYTLKFKLPAADVTRRHTLRHIIQEKSLALFDLVKSTAALDEAYIELEIYHDTHNRRHWENADGIKENLDDILPEWHLAAIDPPRTLKEAAALGVPPLIAKQADIHIKLAGGIERYPLIEAMCEKGFYHVRTGGGNDVLTAQFAEARDAKYIFRSLEDFFGRYGGSSEMTLEPVAGMWRTSRTDKEGTARLSTLPPLVLDVLNRPAFDPAEPLRRAV